MNKISKGYTLTVTSWENDADNYKTISHTVDTKEKAEALYKLMQLCISKNNKPKGIIRLGNTGEEGFNEQQIDLLYDFFKQNPILLEEPLEDEDSMDKDGWNDYIQDLFYRVGKGLLSSSEWYTCRVMESCVVTYSPIDVTPEVINF